jgi:hypothetical protein
MAERKDYIEIGEFPCVAILFQEYSSESGMKLCVQQLVVDASSPVSLIPVTVPPSLKRSSSIDRRCIVGLLINLTKTWLYRLTVGPSWDAQERVLIRASREKEAE